MPKVEKQTSNEYIPPLYTTKIYTRISYAISAGYTTVSLQGSSRSSKTYNTVIWLIHYLLEHPRTRLSIVRKTLPSIRGSVLVDFNEIMDKMGLLDTNSFNKSDLIYTFDNGSWVEFFSTDSEQKLRGRKRDVLFVNEANELKFIEWQQLKMRTTRFAIVDYNPSFTDEHWLCNVNKEESTYHFISTYKDNPFLEQVIIDEIESLQRKNYSLWQIYGLGLQAMIEGLIFEKIELVDEIPRKIKHHYIGMDFGYEHDPTAIVRVGIQDDCLYVEELCYKTQMLTGEIIKELKAKCPDEKIISESADPRLVQEIYRAGLNIHPVQKYGGSVDAGLQKMKEFRICITKGSLNVIKEFKNYVYDKDKEGNFLNTPIDAFNHAIDAIRYVILMQVLGANRRKISLDRIRDAVY